MESQRSRFETWFQRRRGPREPQEEAALLTAADAFDEAQATGTLTGEQLAIVVSAASHSKTLLWANAVDLLGSLSARWPAAANAILQMSQSRKADVRYKAICSLRSETMADITDAVLRAGLMDKSSRVRWKSAHYIEHLEKRHLLPELTAAAAAERKEPTRHEIEWHLRLLRDGYIIEEKADGEIFVWARTSNGSIGKGYGPEEFKVKGIDAIVSELVTSRY